MTACARTGCRISFEREYPWSKFCSLRCQKSTHNARRRAKSETARPKLSRRECKKCGVEYQPRVRRSLFCSTECNYSYHTQSTRRVNLEEQALVDELRAEAARVGRSISWCAQYAIGFGLERLRSQVSHDEALRVEPIEGGSR